MTNKEAMERLLKQYVFTYETKPLEMAYDALEKQVPLKPDVKIADGRKVYYCNVCGCSLCDDDGSMFCSFCGQKVDWSDKK